VRSEIVFADRKWNFCKTKITKLHTDRSIREDFTLLLGSMVEQTSKWWQGLAKELELDIEAPEEQ
jgi:hypothetical protein